MKNLIKREEINIINYSSDEIRNVLDFEYKGRFFEQKYNKGNGWGFKFISEYKNELHIKNKLSVAGNVELIYSANAGNDFGKHLEFSLSKMNLKS